MKNVYKILIAGFIMLFAVNSLQAVTISGTAPTVSSGTTGAAQINALISTLFTNALADANAETAKFGDMSNLTRGFANANAYSAQAATQQGFQDYDIFAITTGAMVGLQAPSYDVGYYKNIKDNIQEDGDVKAGIGTSLAWFSIGVNAKYLFPGLYFNVKYGQLNLKSSNSDDVSYKTRLFGLGANYTWIQSKSLLAGLAKWRGISFGTGFIYNMNEADFNIKINEQSKTADSAMIAAAGATSYVDSATISIDPTLKAGLKTETYTIPFDVTTSVQFLWIMNLNLGAGIDLTFGRTDLALNSDGAVTATVVDTASNTYTTDQAGSVRVDSNLKKQSPSLVHARLMTGIGFNFGPAKVDVPLTWYPIDKAVAIGITAGIVW
jgi:hypothetical protein